VIVRLQKTHSLAALSRANLQKKAGTPVAKASVKIANRFQVVGYVRQPLHGGAMSRQMLSEILEKFA
jgi:hypothetical protein